MNGKGVFLAIYLLKLTKLKEMFTSEETKRDLGVGGERRKGEGDDVEDVADDEGHQGEVEVELICKKGIR